MCAPSLVYIYRSSGEDLENIIYWLALNDDFGYMVPIIPPLPGEVLS